MAAQQIRVMGRLHCSIMTGAAALAEGEFRPPSGKTKRRGINSLQSIRIY
jgi:hypothetical protein